MKEFFGNIKLELDKITWPTGEELKLHTIQVFVFMLILSIFFAGVDAVISVGVAAATREAVETEEDYEEYEDYDLDELLEYDENDDED